MNPANPSGLPTQQPPSPIMNSPISSFQNMQALSTGPQPGMSMPSAPTQQQPQQQNTGNFFTHALPTLGGILGGLVGLPANLLDAVGIPGTIGDIALAGGGAGLGKSLENILEGNNDVGSGVLENAVAGGAGQGIGAGLGGILGMIGGKIGSIGGQSLARTATAKAGAETAQGLADEFGGLHPSLKSDLNFGNSLKLADQVGVPKTAAGFSSARQAGTGTNGYLNGVLDSLVRSKGPVDLANYDSVVTKALKSEPTLGSLTPTTAGRGGLPRVDSLAGNIRSQLSELRDNIGYGNEGPLTDQLRKTISNKVDPDNALNLLRAVREQSSKYAGSLPGTEGAAQYRALNKVYGDLRDSIYNRPEIDSAVSSYSPPAGSPEAEAVLKAAGGNPKLANFLLDTVRNASKAGDITKVESQLVDMGKLGDHALNFQKNVLPGSQQAARAAQAELEANQQPGALMDAAGHIVSGNKAGLLSSVVRSGAKVSAPIAKGVGDLLERMSPFTSNSNSTLSKLLPVMGVTTATSPNFAEGAANQGASMPPIQTQPGSAGGAPTNTYGQLLQAMMAQSILAPSVYGGSATPFLQNAAPTLQKVAGAEAALPATEAAYTAAGGGQGLIPGLLAKLGGLLTGGPASTYSDQSTQLAQQLNALGIPSSFIPQITQNGQSGQLGFQELQRLIDAMGGGTLGAVPANAT